MSLFGNRLKYVSSKVWDATKSDFLFPEIGDPDLKIPELNQKPNIGIAFSGGEQGLLLLTLLIKV